MILEVVIKYDPYHKATYMTVNGVDVMTAPVSAGYGKFKEQIEKKNPIQTWLERRGNWKGILNELIPEESSDNLTFLFTGRKIDYEDLMHACESQNEERKSRCHLKFDLEYEITDEQTARNIEEVVKTLQSDRFKKLVDECNQLGFDKELGEKYKNFKADYDRARNAEFTITVAGIFSSGKSTIINSLIRHKALPVSQDTCTKKICKIRDNPELKPNELNLLICGDDKKLKKKVVFSDADKAVNDEKCSKLIESIKTDSGYTILEANLGHLYPNEKSREMFKLVIIDTPGTDSNESDDGKGHNADEDIALDAVFKSNGDMVILSIKAADVDSQGLTRLVGGISNKFDKDSDVYNDRFLFVVNQCDQRQFTLENTTTDFINHYRGKLKTKTQNPSFNPRIFPLCAAVPGFIYADDKSCWNGTENFSKYIYGADVGVAFMKRHIDPNPNYYFSQYCDVPQYRKEQYAARFNKIKDNDTEGCALLIQSGFVCLEDAIKDYIERFAYPRRIQRIQKTYETIPVSVINCIKAQEAALMDAKESLGTARNEGKAAEEKEKEEKENADKLTRLKSVIDSLKNKVDECNYDEAELYSFSADFSANVYNGCRRYDENEMEYEKATEALKKIQENVQLELNAYSNKVRDLGKKYFEKMNALTSCIKSNLEELNKLGDFDFGGFDFSKSETFSGGFDFNFDDFNFDDFDINDYAWHETKRIHNPEKDAYCSFWDLFGHIKKAFAKKTIEVTEHKVNMKSYIKDLCNTIDGKIIQYRNKIAASFKRHNSDVKNAVIAQLREIDMRRNDSFRKITQYKDNVKDSYATVEALQEKIGTIESELQWLDTFINKEKISMQWGMEK